MFNKMVDFEEDFPRGGTRPSISKKRPKQDDNLFSATVKHKAKRQRKEKKIVDEAVTEESFHSSLKIQGTLTYSSLRTDIIILSCIRHITNFSLELELPGLTFGHVNITNISDPFTKYLNVKLEQNDEDSDTFLAKMFTVGQFVLTKVINIESKDKGLHVECTINPREIYSDKLHNSFEKGLLVWASVQSELEHGYEMNIGVKNCRIFLPSKNVDKDRTLLTGEPVWCTIHKCDSSNVASTLRVSSKSEHINKSTIEDIKSLHDLIPGMQVEILIDKITSNGIQGKFLNDFFGHIDEAHLINHLSKYKEGNLLMAYVLYIDHTIKVTHLTTYDLKMVPSPKYGVGEILQTEVILKAHNGVYLQLPSKEKCFVTNKRLVHSLPKQYSNMDVSDTIRLKFAAGTRHTCRILDYNHLSRTYIGTVEPSLMKEKIFTVSDVKVGQLLDVTVENIKPEGLVVAVGHIRGFVPNLYLSNVKYSDTIKKKFKEGLCTKARILSVNDGNVILTLKPGQVDSEQCLTDLSEANRGDRYPGVIVQTKPYGALVVFYGNVKGWISRKYLDEQEDDQKPDPQLFFYRGQVVNPWVLGVKNEKAILSVRQPKNFDTFGSLTIGQNVKGIVSAIRKDKLFIKTFKGRPIGVVPVNHLSASLSLCPILLKTYSVGDKIDHLMCIDNSNSSNVLSKREAWALKTTPKYKLKKFEKLKHGAIIRCSYLSHSASGIYVQPILSNYKEKILIRNKDVAEKGTAIPKFEPHQSILTRVLQVQHTPKKIRLTAKFSEVFNNSVESVLDLFGQHIKDLEHIRKVGKEKNWDLCQYEPGERVECHVKKLGDQGGCLVALPNGVNGLVAPRLCPDNIKIGDTLTGVFLSQNFTEDYVEVCLKPNICQKINKIQNGTITITNFSSCIAEIILNKSQLSIGVLKEKGGNRQLVYIPLYINENDFEGCRQYYQTEKLKLCVCGKSGNSLIGMSKKLFVTLDRNKTAVIKAKALRAENTNGSSGTDEISTARSSTSESLNTMDEDIPENVDSIDDDISDEEQEQELTTDVDEQDATIILDEEDDSMDENDELSDAEMDDSDSEEEETKNAPAPTKRISNGIDKTTTFSTVNSSNVSAPVISGVKSFFDTDTNKDVEESSDDEVQELSVKKKKKPTPAERAQLAREEEERISRIEKELADSTKTPESAEQFNRLLLANPNSSEFWTKYMAFHTAATEFDKARAVAKRALETINTTLVDELFNVWIALLNLENMLGTQESFDKTFTDAVKYNDSLQVYLKTIQMLAENGKLADMEEKIKKVRNKHKQEPQMWLEVGKTYYRLDKLREARNTKDAALKSLSNKKIQLEVIVRFAVMEFRFGDANHGAAIFETMLSSDPKKVTIWTTYIDQLVKKSRIDETRQVLERAVSQRLPLKSMKTLFLKYRMFEEQHGTPESVEEVKEKAKQFASKVFVK